MATITTTDRGASEPAIQNNVGLKKRRSEQREEKVHLHKEECREM